MQLTDEDCLAHLFCWLSELVTGHLTRHGDRRECMRHCCGFASQCVAEDDPWVLETERQLKAICDEPHRNMGVDYSLIHALAEKLWERWQCRHPSDPPQVWRCGPCGGLVAFDGTAPRKESK